jgi:hypothetical protein
MTGAGRPTNDAVDTVTDGRKNDYSAGEGWLSPSQKMILNGGRAPTVVGHHRTRTVRRSTA